MLKRRVTNKERFKRRKRRKLRSGCEGPKKYGFVSPFHPETSRVSVKVKGGSRYREAFPANSSIPRLRASNPTAEVSRLSSSWMITEEVAHGIEVCGKLIESGDCYQAFFLQESKSARKKTGNGLASVVLTTVGSKGRRLA
ncbi:hypothetical protein ACOSQ2_024000 [Xanthoceras sorbifolium]